MTKQGKQGMDDLRDMPIEITSEMIEAGLRAYAMFAWHDSASVGSPKEVVEAILHAGISVCMPPDTHR